MEFYMIFMTFVEVAVHFSPTDVLKQLDLKTVSHRIVGRLAAIGSSNRRFASSDWSKWA